MRKHHGDVTIMKHMIMYPKRVLLSPWRSSTPRALSAALGLVLRTPGQIVANPGTSDRIKLLVNWGTRTGWGGIRTLNAAKSVNIASNKLLTMRVLEKQCVPTLEYTTDADEAQKWLAKNSVIAHHDPRGHSGHGLSLHKKGSTESLPRAQVYTKYFPKKVESRVHIIQRPNGPQTFYLEKKRVSKERYPEFGLEDSPDTYIRTYDNGWIFAREVKDDAKAIALALKALNTVELDFGAVDIMFDGNRHVVGEINTAPGLEGECLDFYVENLKAIL